MPTLEPRAEDEVDVDAPTRIERPSSSRDTIAHAKTMLDSEDLNEEDEPAAPKSDVIRASDSGSADDPRSPSGEDVSLDESAETLRPRPSARSATGEAPRLGTFGPYQLSTELAAGRTSTVFLARRAGERRKLALKVLLPGTLKDDAGRGRFLRAAEVAASVQHPGIARFLQSGVDQGWAFVAFERVKGQTLDEVARGSGPLNAELPRLVLEVIRALAHAHEHGVVHGDLKPENVRVTPSGTPMLLELGLPRPADRPGPARARPFTAPEVLAGGSPDEASDIYAAGALLFLAASGGVDPGQGGGLARLLLGAPLPPGAFQAHVPWGLDAIVLKAMAPRPEDRYPSAKELAVDLQRCMFGGVVASPRSRAYRARLWVIQRPAPAAALLLAVIALLGGLVGGAAALASHAADRLANAPDTADRLGPDATGSESPVSAALPPGQRALGALGSTPDRASSPSAAEAGAAAREAGARELLALGEAALAAEQPSLAERAFAAALELHPGEDAAAAAGVEQARALRVRLDLELADPLPTGTDPATPETADRQAGGGLEPAAARALLARAQDHLAAGEHDQARRALAQALAGGASTGGDRAGGAAGIEAARAAEAAKAFEQLLGALAEAGAERASSKTEASADQDAAEARARLAEQERERAEALEAALVEARRLANSDPAAAGRALLAGLSQDPLQPELLATFQAILSGAVAQRPAVGPAVGPATGPADGRARLTAEARKEALAAVDRGRNGFRTGEDPTQVVASYLDALSAFARAKGLSGAGDPTRTAGVTEGLAEEQRAAARELASILRDDGRPELADAVLLANGLEADEPLRTEVPEDPHLVVEEAERVSIRRAYGGRVRFLPTTVFDDLRRWIAEQGDRLRVRIEVRCRVAPGFPPRIHVTGLRVRVEDLQAKTLGAWRNVSFSGGPYPRVIQVDTRGGRLVSPFERGHQTQLAAGIAEASQIARAEVERLLAR